MKRSEMELNIATNIVITKPNIDFKEAQELAEIALISVLENGMLPPKACIERSVRVGDEQRTAYHNTNEWEPENE